MPALGRPESTLKAGEETFLAQMSWSAIERGAELKAQMSGLVSVGPGTAVLRAQEI